MVVERAGRNAIIGVESGGGRSMSMQRQREVSGREKQAADIACCSSKYAGVAV